ncbi:MAG: hypothetical protein IPO15_27375 [Anaerolineae bacterium]|uniref:hypothetical protein n=1 Tax=Candidatus Amarolinea dominans TaxID=3140696 RepID=UPI0031357195|nr:hypothetical protein [Anaerolineae bacterium]
MNRALAVLIVEASESGACRLVDWLSAAATASFGAGRDGRSDAGALAAQPWGCGPRGLQLAAIRRRRRARPVQEAGLDIAFIAVSGAQGEEAAAIIKEGGRATTC